MEGGPKFVGGDLLCHDNNIKTLEGFPISVGGRIRLDRNPVWILWNLFSSPELRSRFAGQRHTNSIDKVELFNDFGITDGEVVILDRLNEFLEMIGSTDAHVSQVPLTNSILQKIERNYRLI